MELPIQEIINHLKSMIADQAQEIAVLKATIDKMVQPKPVTTAVTDQPNVEGTQGIK